MIVVTDAGGVRFSARNCLAGTVARVQAGAVNAEVVIDLPGGLQVAAIVTQASADRMGLGAGQPVTALFKASSVIVAVPARSPPARAQPPVTRKTARALATGRVADAEHAVISAWANASVPPAFTTSTSASTQSPTCAAPT